MATERLQKILSNAGVASRRQAEQLILEGRVAVNGTVQRVLGARADPDVDEITVDGEPVVKRRYVYLALNKPPGVVTSASDELGRKTVLDLVGDVGVQLHPIGRLDRDSEGLLLLTNDGNLTNLLTHPRHEVEKEYLVGVHQPVSRRDQQRMVRGILSDGEKLRAESVAPIDPGSAAGLPPAGGWLLVTLREGKNRQIRRMLAALGRRVVLLRRTRIGPIALGDLAPGETRPLAAGEVAALYAAARVERDNPGRDGPALPAQIAIDGGAATGKTTLGHALAERYGYRFLDTGQMYRAFTLAALRRGIPASDAEACARLAAELDMELTDELTVRVLLDGEDVTQELRSRPVESNVSAYSAIPGVRQVMVARQRAFAASHRAVLAGRDIGTVVLPEAPLKVFLAASPEVRAKRRSQQAIEWGTEQQADEAHRDIAGRDAIDSSREESPLRAAPDAIVIDTTELGPEAVLAQVVERIECAGSE
ncbi:MAG: hypothetical protein Kow0010_09610 [Dehalococcoidia bacterium]